MAERDAFEVALDRLDAAASKARRRSVPFPSSFIASDDVSSLAALIRGGRGGAVRLKLYMLITMMATREPYDLRRPPTPLGWAALLGLQDGGAKRRVTDAIKWLETEKFIALEKQPSRPSRIVLLDPLSRVGGKYELPSTQGRYVSLPVEFWTNGWVVSLSPTEIALLLVLLDNQGGYSDARYVTKYRRERYHLSTDTWTRATNGLKEKGLLIVRRENLGDEFEYYRKRSAYWVERKVIEDSVAPRPSKS